MKALLDALAAVRRATAARPTATGRMRATTKLENVDVKMAFLSALRKEKRLGDTPEL